MAWLTHDPALTPRAGATAGRRRPPPMPNAVPSTKDRHPRAWCWMAAMRAAAAVCAAACAVLRARTSLLPAALARLPCPRCAFVTARPSRALADTDGRLRGRYRFFYHFAQERRPDAII